MGPFTGDGEQAGSAADDALQAAREEPAQLVVSACELRKTFGTGVQALAGVSLEIRARDVYVLFGPNGAGKTTFIHCLLGLVTPDSGTVTVSGWRHPRDWARRRVGVLFEDAANLYPYLTVQENIEYFAVLNGATRKAARETARSLAARFGLCDHLTRPAALLSRGLRQRLAMACSLSKGGLDLLCLDEPTMGLDLQARAELADLIQGFHDARAVLICTHDVDFALAVATTFAVLVGGRIVDEGAAARLQDPQRVRRRLLEAFASGGGLSEGTDGTS